jgi:hypothetical protein
MPVQGRPGSAPDDVGVFSEREGAFNVGWPTSIDLDPLRVGGLARFYAWPGFHFDASSEVFTECQFHEAGGKLDVRTPRH